MPHNLALRAAQLALQRCHPLLGRAQVVSHHAERCVCDIITERARLHASRCRWLFSLLYVGGLRVSEMCGCTMGRFFGRRGADGRERWWLEGHRP